MEERTSFDCVKKLDFGHNREKIESDGFSVSTEPKEEDKKDIVVYSNLIQRSWSSTDFPNVKSERLETRSKSCQKLHQYDYCAIYKRKREEKRKRMEEEIKAQANSFKSRPMPNFMSRKPIKTPLKITLPITPEVLKRTKDTKVQRKQKFTDWEAKLESAQCLEASTSCYKENIETNTYPPESKENKNIASQEENMKMEPDSTCELE